MKENTEDLKQRFGFMIPDKVEGYEKDGKMYLRLIGEGSGNSKVSYADVEVYRSGIAESEKWISPIEARTPDTQKPADNYICCEALDKALGDHNGLHSQTIGSLNSDVIDSIIMYKGGEYKIRNRIIVQYCPFCGKPRRRASEYKEAK